MYSFFYKKFSDYIIENSEKYLIFLIPGDQLKDEFDWYGNKRAEAFNKLNSKNLESDIENRDFFFSHMLIWHKEGRDLAGGQRFMFSEKYLINTTH